MKAGLPELEPKLLERWEKIDLFSALRAAEQGPTQVRAARRPALCQRQHPSRHTRSTRSSRTSSTARQQMLGKDAHYVPGWDCHGLPIEWKIEEKYRAAGKNKDEVPIRRVPRGMPRLRRSIGSTCSASEFKRLGVLGDWDRPYTTMDFAAEAQIIAPSCTSSCMNGGLYRGAKPVMWSVIEKTALAEAEVEYHDHTSTAIWVKFPVVKAEPARARGRLGGDLDHHALDHARQPRHRLRAGDRLPRLSASRRSPKAALAKVGERLVLAEALAAQAMAAAQVTDLRRRARSRSDLAGTVCAPSLARPRAMTSTCRCWPAISSPPTPAPASSISRPAMARTTGIWARQHGIEVPETVQPDGSYRAVRAAVRRAARCWPRARTANTIAGREAVIEALQGSRRAAGPGQARPLLSAFLALQGAADLPHHAAMVHRHGQAGDDGKTLREKALAAIDATRFVPAQGRNRICAAWSRAGPTGASRASAPGACRSRSSSRRRPARCCATMR